MRHFVNTEPFLLKNCITSPSLKCTELVLIAINVPAKYNDIIAMHVLKFHFIKLAFLKMK